MATVKDVKNRKIVPLTEMKCGQHGKVTDLAGGEHFTAKLSSLGIRINTHITMVSTMAFSGPVIVNVHRRHVAIGHRMAERIMVELI